MLSRGYTTIRDVGGASKAHSDATAEGLIPGPRIFQGGPVVSQTGGHADSTDPNGPVGGGCCGGINSAGGMGAVCDGVPQCLAMARDIMRKGADHIKICVSAKSQLSPNGDADSASPARQTSGGVGSVTDAIDSTQFTLEELLAITTTVKNMRGTITTAHCYTSEGIRHSIAVSDQVFDCAKGRLTQPNNYSGRRWW
jgi:imidazolonepropionase-like amidohydrolase